MARADVLEVVANLIGPTVVRVGIDGPDAAGKTTLADDLAAVLRARDREVIRVSVDDHPRPPAARYARGRDSPEGYYRDAVDHEAFLAALHPPLRPGAVVICDGIFLLRPELRGLWDLGVHLTAPFDVRLRRALARDVPRLGTAAEVERRYRVRYEPGQELYRREARPERWADLVIANDDPTAPRLRAD